MALEGKFRINCPPQGRAHRVSWQIQFGQTFRLFGVGWKFWQDYFWMRALQVALNTVFYVIRFPEISRHIARSLCQFHPFSSCVDFSVYFPEHPVEWNPETWICNYLLYFFQVLEF